MVIASAVVIAVVVGARLTMPETLFYSPYPPNSLLPAFHPLVGGVLLLLAAPAVLAPKQQKVQDPQHPVDSTEVAV